MTAWTLQDNNSKEILLAVDLGYDINLIGQDYVKAFNKSGKYRILEWEVRNPRKDELQLLKKFNQFIDFQWVGDHWESVQREKGGKETRKHIFLIKLKKLIENPIKSAPADKAAESLRQNFKRNVKGD